MLRFFKRWYKKQSFESKTKRKLRRLEEIIMSVKEEILGVIAERKVEVDTKITDLNQRITELEQSISNSESVSPEDVQEIKDAINTIGNV